MKAEEASGGLRYSITVTQFENRSGWAGYWDIGDAWGTVLTDMLNQTGKFIVLGETDMRYAAMDEQDFAASGRTASGKTRVYVSCDGVKVPLVTDQEKKKRRQKVRERRRRCGRKSRPLARAKPGADNAWKEFRLVAHYDETQSHCHVSVTRGNHEAAGRLMARDAKSVGLHDADERIANVDGAPWIRAQLELHGTVDHIGLDFYHLSEYVHAARRDVFAEDEADDSAWADEMLHKLKHEGYSAAWQMALDCRSKASRSSRATVDRLLGYMSERREMIRYPQFLARGWQIGSGPIEAQCKTATSRVKGSAKRWDGANAEAVMALACLDNSRLWQNYWLTPDPAAN